MKITKIWIVRDPSEVSEMGDILFETDVNGLARIILGTGLSTWEHEHTTLYTEAGEAKHDADARMKKRTKKEAVGLPERVARRYLGV